jgi:hypothetical protein
MLLKACRYSVAELLPPSAGRLRYGMEVFCLNFELWSKRVAWWFTAIDRGKRTRRMDLNAAFSEIARVNSKRRAGSQPPQPLQSV